MRKQLIIPVISLMTLTACSSTQYVQTVNVKSAESNSNSAYSYTDRNVTISYNFWAQNGNPGFTIMNNTDEIIQVDLTKSFFVMGSTAKDYFLNRTYSSSTNETENTTVSLSGTALGRWIPSGFLGSKTLKIGKGVANSTSSGITYEEKPIILIPAHCSKRISEYAIQSTPIQDCSMVLFPNRRGTVYTYASDAMPTFKNIITYRVGENGTDNTVENKFYITGYRNQQLKKATADAREGCKKNAKITVFTESSPMSFYILYDGDTDNRFSADANNNY